MSSLPSGTVTFLFTDIEGSTRYWEQYPQGMQRALQQHDSILRSAIEDNGGYVFKTVGDAFRAAFPTASQALRAALDAQHALAFECRVQSSRLKVSDSTSNDSEPETFSLELRVRMALHTGVTDERDSDYFGQPLNRVARLLSAAHGGQILMSLSTEGLVQDDLPADVTLHDLGEHRLKDLQRRERIFQVVSRNLPTNFAPLKTLDTHPNNLPLQATPFVGRTKELAALTHLLLREDARLVTLTGPGGAGKTRLALQTAAEVVDHFRDGAFFISLAGISVLSSRDDPNLVTHTIAQTLGAREVQGQSPAQRLKDYLQDKQILLVLDNFEQLVSSALLLSDLLGIAPGLKIMVTSREVLRLRAEREFPVPPMQLPERGRSSSPELLSQYEAVKLFIQRALEVKPDFQVTNSNAPAVAEICHRLDGLPLAIELAATRIRMLTPQAILTRLGRMLNLLTGGAIDSPLRQQTLSATIEWSYDLLTSEEQLFFRRMAVFSGGCTLDAAEAVCSDFGLEKSGLETEIRNPKLSVFEGLTSLVEKSLLHSYEGPGGEPRFVMLETIHEYALERLEESREEAEALKRQHALFFTRLAQEAKTHLRGPGQATWMDILEAERDNIRAALLWAQEARQVDIALGLAGALSDFWHRRGDVSEGRAHLAAALQLEAPEGLSGAAGVEGDEGSPHMEARSEALLGAGLLAFWQGDYAASRDYYEQSLVISKRFQDGARMIRAVSGLGDVARFQGNFDGAKFLFEESLALSERIQDLWGLAKSFSNLGYLAYRASNHAEARALHEESLRAYRSLGDVSETGGALWRLALVAREEGDYDLARRLLDESLVCSRQVCDKLRAALSTNSLGELERLQNNYVAARHYYEEALGSFRELGNKWNIAVTLHNLGHVCHREGDHRRAEDHFSESLTLCRQLNDKEIIAACLAGLGGTASTQEKPERAACLLAASEALINAVGTFLDPADRVEFERNRAIARAQMDDASWEVAWKRGQDMTLDEAVAFALEGVGAGSA